MRDKLNVMVVGRVPGPGGREHAILKACARSERVRTVFFVSPNAEVIKEEKIVPVTGINPRNFSGLIDFARGHRVAFTIVGPEALLFAGIVDAFEKEGLPIIGPSQNAAWITEGNKADCKKMVLAAQVGETGIPTAGYASFTEAWSARSYIAGYGVPCVIKPAFVTGGKGVRVITTNLEDAYEAVDELMATEAGKIILVEEFLKGRELSFIVMVDETGGFACLIPTQDYKELNGKMTGGMGARTVPEMTQGLYDKIIEKIVRPTIAKLQSIGVPYKGFLYFGLMIVEEDGQDEPYVLELNCRLGDPETQVILPLMESDFVELCIAFFENRLDRAVIGWQEGEYVVVVVAAPGYPAKPVKGDVVYNLERVAQMADIDVFYAGVALNGAGDPITDGGRVVAIGARGDTLDEAYVKAHGAASFVSIGDPDPSEGTQVIRSDVGLVAKE